MSLVVCASCKRGTVCSKFRAVVFILSTDRIGADCCTGAGTYVWCAYIRLATSARHCHLRMQISWNPNTLSIQGVLAATCGDLLALIFPQLTEICILMQMQEDSCKAVNAALEMLTGEKESARLACASRTGPGHSKRAPPDWSLRRSRCRSMAAEEGCGILLMPYISGGFICISKEVDGWPPAARNFCRSARPEPALKQEALHWSMVPASCGPRGHYANLAAGSQVC